MHLMHIKTPRPNTNIFKTNFLKKKIAPCGPTHVWDLAKTGEITRRTICPADFGLPEHPLASVAGGSNAADNAKIMRSLLNGELEGSSQQAVLDFVLLNTAALLFVDEKAATLPDAVELARTSISQGRAKAALDAFIKASSSSA